MQPYVHSVFSTQRQRHLYFSLQYLEKLYGTSLVVFIVGITEEKWEQACVKLDTYNRPFLLKKAAYVLCIVHGTAILLVSFFEKTLGSRSMPSTIFYIQRCMHFLERFISLFFWYISFSLTCVIRHTFLILVGKKILLEI